MAAVDTLGSGFVEKIYENALAYEIRKRRPTVAQQYGVVVRHDDVTLDECTTDLLMEDTALVGLKAVRALDDIHLAQCMNYLKATDLRCPFC